MTKKTIRLSICLAILPALSYAAQAGEAIYAAPGGNTAGTGAIDSPVDIYTAVSRVEAGGTIYLRGGIYYLTKGLDLDKIGSEAAPYRLWAYENEKPVFDCSQETVPNANNLGIRMTNGCWWHIKRLEIRNAYNSGFKIRNGSHNTFEQCVAHHNGGSGFHIGYEHEADVNPDGSLAAYNTWLNCDAYNNFDWWSTSDGRPAAGTNADGFACKSNAGKGNRYIGCRAWSNSDDNWDFFECGYGIQLLDCWAWNAGVMADHAAMYLDRTGRPLTDAEWDGNGNGFKIGGGCLLIGGRACRLESRGTHVLRNCIAFNNTVNGFDQNNHPYGAIIENCIGFNNRCNFRFYDPNKNGTTFTFRNNISWGGSNADTFDRISIAANAGNSWNQPGLTSNPAAEFVSLSPGDANAVRTLDGSLPDDFARLNHNSAFIDKGLPTEAITIDVDDIHLPAIAYRGMAPDLGAFEYPTSSEEESLLYEWNFANDSTTFPTANPFTAAITTVAGLTFQAHQDGISSIGNFGIISYYPRTYNGTVYNRSLTFGGDSYWDSEINPSAPRPNQRFMRFPVPGNCTVKMLIATTTATGNPVVYITDGAAFIDSITGPAGRNAAAKEGIVRYTGNATTLYIGNKKMSGGIRPEFYYIKVSAQTATSVKETVWADKSQAVSSVCYDLTGRQITSRKKGFLIRKTLYEDGMIETQKIWNH
ncbi:MAG: right-handed parallel beta-helix repeat-containing protein [Dysgonamonadaceae bacterium]|jgi:hypothetical protein|nr:right-handed parallel beta-helix repeat-containing protein [Dysgonamonadaceae bacterium]